MRRPRGSRDLVLVVVAAVLMLFVAGVASIISPPDEGLGVRGSSLSAGAQGAKAAFLLLRRLGYVVERSYEPLETVRANPQTDVIVLMAPHLSPSKHDVESLTRFVEAGGVAIVGEAREWLPSMRQASGSISKATTPEVVLPSPLALGAPRIRMDHTESAGVPGPPYTTIYADARGAAVTTAKIGRGRVVFWASALPVTNAAIDEAGHVELVVNAIGPPLDRRVIWDERYHGHTRSAWSYTQGTPLPAALAQLGVLGLAAVLTVSFRRRPLRAVPDPPRTAPLEFIDTMGGLYQRAGATTAAVGVALAHLRRRLIGVAGLPADADDARVAQAAAPRAGLTPEALGGLLARARDAARGTVPLSARDAVAIVRQLQDAARSVERHARGPATHD
jgi:hypothetical protein